MFTARGLVYSSKMVSIPSENGSKYASFLVEQQRRVGRKLLFDEFLA
jgi:hypothetical protein